MNSEQRRESVRENEREIVDDLGRADRDRVLGRNQSLVPGVEAGTDEIEEGDRTTFKVIMMTGG